MEQKLLNVLPSLCSGCKNCELACAFAHGVDGSPAPSRIRAFKWGENRGMVVVCMQCDSAACVSACPCHALFRDLKTGAIYHAPQRCIRCHSCVEACPFGNMRWDEDQRFPSKCDLCKGDPVCARFCPTGTLRFGE